MLYSVYGVGLGQLEGTNNSTFSATCLMSSIVLIMYKANGMLRKSNIGMLTLTVMLFTVKMATSGIMVLKSKLTMISRNRFSLLFSMLCLPKQCQNEIENNAHYEDERYQVEHVFAPLTPVNTQPVVLTL